MIMAAISTTNGYEKSFPPMNVASKTKNGMTCIKTAINDSISFSEANRTGGAVSISEMESLPAVDERVDCLRDQRKMQLNKEIGFLDLSPFTIRNFVSTVRSKEFSKCWPFRRGILERCVSNGMTPQLPPFDLPSRGQVQVCLENQPAIANDTCIQIVSKATKSSTQSLLAESDKQKLMIIKAPAEAPGTCALVNAEVDHVVEAQLEGKESEAEGSEAISKVQQSGSMAIEGEAPEKSHVGEETKADKVVEADLETSRPGLPHTNQVTVMKDRDDDGGTGEDVSGDLKTSCSEIEDVTSVMNHPDPNPQTLKQTNPEFDTIQVVRADSNVWSDAATSKIVGQDHNGDNRLFFEKFSTQVQGQKLPSTLTLEPVQFATCIESCCMTDGGKQENSVGATTPPTEGDLMGHQNRMEIVKNSKDLGVTGINSDSLSPQLCPVCVNFTSTSNTALNAHIDHCLATALPSEKAEVRLQKNRMKARKIRSMADICAVAPSRTLEDLEMSSQLWAVVEETPTENAACSLGWMDVTVRRQPRTHFHRGPARVWKRESRAKGENGSQRTLPSVAHNSHHLENIGSKYPVQKTASRHTKLSSCLSTKKCELQESCRNQQSRREGLFFTRPSRPTNVPSCVNIGELLGRHNRLVQSSGNLRIAQGSNFVGNASVSSSVRKGSSSLQSSLEGVAPQQLLSVVAKNKKLLESDLTQNGETLECLHQDKGFIGKMKRKKKKNGVSSQISAPCIVRQSRFTSLLEQEPADHVWLGLFNRHGIIPVDTSAEEVNRLLKKRCHSTDFPQEQQLEAEIAEQHRLPEGFSVESGDTNNSHSKIAVISKSVVAAELHVEASSLKNNGMFKSVKKRKFGQLLELDENSENASINIASKQVAIENQSELSVENNKVALKTKRITNITTVPGDKDKRPMLHGACEISGVEKEACVNEWRKVTSKGEPYSKRTQIKISKRKRMVTTKGDTLREACNRNKHARLHTAKLQLPSGNVSLCHAIEQSKSPEGSSVVSNGALAEHRRQGGIECDSTDAASIATENPHKEMECGNMNEELESPKTNRAISSHICSKVLNEEEHITFFVNQMKNLAGSANDLGKSGDTCQSDANLFSNGPADCTRDCMSSKKKMPIMSSKKKMPIVDLAETHSTSMTETLKERVNAISVHEQTARLSPAPSVTSLTDAAGHKFSSQTSSSCTPVNISSLGFITGTCCRIGNAFTRWEAGVSNELPFVQPADSIRTMHSSHSYTPGLEAPECAAHAVSFKQRISSANIPFRLPDNTDLSVTAPLVGMTNHNLHMIYNPDSLKRELSGQKLTPQVSFTVTGFCDKSDVMTNQCLQNTLKVASNMDRSDLFLSTNSTAQNSREICPREGLQKVKSVANGSVENQNIQGSFGPKKPASFMQSKVLAPVSSGDSIQESCKLVHEVATLHDTQMPTMSSPKMSFPSDLLVDVARTIANDSKDRGGTRDTPSNKFTSRCPVEHIKQSTSNALLKCVSNEVRNAHGHMNLMPLKNTCFYNTDKSGGSIEPQILQSAMHLLNGCTSTSSADLADLMPESVNGTSQLLTLPSNQPICGEFSSAEMNGRSREKLSRAELTSSLNAYGSVDYPGEPGVVHIFGNPVFKLMGKNVMVTNKNVKSLGMGNTVFENGRQCLKKASSVQSMECMGTAKDLGLFQDTQNQFTETFLEARVFKSPNSSCWQGGSCKPRNHSVGMDNLVIDSHTTQNLSLPALGSIECSRYKHPSKCSIPLIVSGKRLKPCDSATGVELKRQAVVNSVNQMHSGVIAPSDSSQCRGNLLPTIRSKGGNATTQPNSRPWFEYPLSLSMDEPQLHGQGDAMPFRQRSNASADLSVDLQKLGLQWGNQQSGTLSDIFQGLRRSKDRLWSTQPGPVQQTQLSNT